MPTLRSQTGKGKSDSKGAETKSDPKDAETVVSSLASSPGPATPTQDHEFARAAITPVIRRSRRLNVDATSPDTLELPSRKPESRHKSEGKRKAEEPLQEEVSTKDLSAEEVSMVLSAGSAQVNLVSSNVTNFHQVDISGRGDLVGCKNSVRDGKATNGPFVHPSHINEITIPNSLVNKDDIEMHFEAGEASFKLDSDQQGWRSNGKVVSDNMGGTSHNKKSTNINIPFNMHDIEMQFEVGEVSAKLDLSSRDDRDAPFEVNQEELDSEHMQRPPEEAGAQNGVRGLQSPAEASRSRFLRIARNRAFHFAHFDADGDEAPAGAPPPRAVRRRGRQPLQADEHHQPQPQVQEVDWPGPFSTARQLVSTRAMAAAARQNAGAPESKISAVNWQPTRAPRNQIFSRRKCPSLQNLCLSVLANNAEDVVSLEGVPDLIRLRISAAICERRQMTSKTLSLFFQGEPSEVHSVDCTQVCEDELVEMMKGISPGRLEKLHLGFCGRALSERCLSTTIAAPASTTPLKSISLVGAYRLSDQGLEALLHASPQLVHLDLSNCSFLTNASVAAVARCVGQTLESLVLDGCPNVNVMVVVHDIVQMAKLQKLSLADVGGVTDEVVSELCVQLGLNFKELVLSRCSSLTDAAVAAIGSCCTSLQSLNLAQLPLLTDVAIAHITDNLRKIQDLNLKRCKFSDEAIATFVTASGGALLNLSLNSVQQVADQTMVALTRHSHASLECLDLSFCRLVDDECLGLLADSCLQLKELRLYGCTQVTNKFVNGHSNANLKVIGLAYSI